MAKSASRERLEGSVRDITHAGEAVVETERGIVLMHGALPGERVRLELIGGSRGVLRGRLLERLQDSPERVEPRCPRVAQCGGCPLMPLSPPAQLAWKRAHLARALGMEAESLELVASPEVYGYRGRARLAWARVGGRALLGYRASASHDVVDAPDCAVLAPALATGYARLRSAVEGVLQGRGELHLALGEGGRAVALLASEGHQPPELYRALDELARDPALAGVSLSIAGGAPATHGETRQVDLAADGQALWGPPFGFAQGNRGLNPQLVSRVVALAEPEGTRVLELYAGHGNFTVALAATAREVLAVESDAAAAEACRRNIALRGYDNVRVRADDAAKAASGRDAVDIVVLDPPRTGAREALAGIAARKPKRIVYVSCDPTTLKRDLAELATHSKNGYALDAAVGFDMFPHTPHVEAVVRLSRSR